MRIARVASALALTLIAAAPLRGSDRQPTHREQLKQFHDAWVAAGRPWPDAARLEPKFGTDVPEFVNVHAYDFQANTSSDLIMDDGNGYRYFGAPAVPYMAASVQLPSGVAIDSIHLSSCAAHAGDLVLALYDNGTGGSGSGGEP